MEAERAGKQRAGKLLDAGIVFLHRVVEEAARGGELVLDIGELGLQLLEYFDTLWANRAGVGIEYTADFGVYADPTQANYWLYRIMESTGLSTF